MKMALQWIAVVLQASVCLFFLHNVSTIISYAQKLLLDIKTAITNLDLDEGFYFHESAALDNLHTPEQALIPGI